MRSLWPTPKCETTSEKLCFLCGCRVATETVGVSTAKGGETTEGSSIASNEATVEVSTSKGGETTEGSSIASNEATFRVSTGKGGETTEGSLIAGNKATVGVSMILNY